MKMIQKFGVNVLTKNRCYFYIISGNKNSLKILKNKIKKYRKSTIGSDGVFIRYEHNYFSEIRIQFRYYEELDRILNRGAK